MRRPCAGRTRHKITPVHLIIFIQEKPERVVGLGDDCMNRLRPSSHGHRKPVVDMP